MEALFISGADVKDPDGEFDKTFFHPFQNSSTATHTSVISYRISKDYITPISHQIIFDKEEAYSSVPVSVGKVSQDLLRNFGYERRAKGSRVEKEIFFTSDSFFLHRQPPKYQLSTGEVNQRWAISFRTAENGGIEGLIDGKRSSLRIKGGFGELNLFGICEPIPSDIIVAKKPAPKPKVVKKATPSEVVAAASGTGFIISRQGHIVTNAHVVNGCKEVKAHHKGVAHRSTVVSVDKVNDLALLKSSFSPSASLKLTPSQPFLMQDIYVAGYPFGKSISGSVKVTKGIVSSLSGLGNNFSSIQIDAALQPGNSGGPIVDESGNVVAVAVAKLDLKKVIENWGVVPENTNFGIKASALENFLEGNSVNYDKGSEKTISKKLLAKHISDNTLYLSCWMTMAQIQQLRAKKVLFSDLD